MAYYLRNDDTGAKRAPSSSEIDRLIRGDLKPMLNVYASRSSIEKVGVFVGYYLLRVQFKEHDDKLVHDLLSNPDDDGNFYIGKFGWHAKVFAAMPASTKRLSPKRCPNGYRRSKKTGHCEKY